MSDLGQTSREAEREDKPPEGVKRSHRWLSEQRTDTTMCWGGHAGPGVACLDIQVGAFNHIWTDKLSVSITNTFTPVCATVKYEGYEGTILIVKLNWQTSLPIAHFLTGRRQQWWWQRRLRGGGGWVWPAGGSTLFPSCLCDSGVRARRSKTHPPAPSPSRWLNPRLFLSFLLCHRPSKRALELRAVWKSNWYKWQNVISLYCTWVHQCACRLCVLSTF